jgi:hypothetical protein
VDNPSLLTLLSVILSALITSAGIVLAAYVSKDRENKADSTKETILKPSGYVAPAPKSKNFWNWQSLAVIALSLIVLTVFIRWLLGLYTPATAEYS